MANKVRKAKKGAIHINPAHKGDFTAKAKAHKMGVQAFARYVLSHKGQFDAGTIKQANFARNSKKFNR